jgi:hypothetical protein
MRQRPSRWLFHLAAVAAASLLLSTAMGQGALRFDDIPTRIVECASPEPGLTDPQVEGLIAYLKTL